MQDRMTAASFSWRTDAPPANTVCEVWYATSVILATHDGHVWRTTEGAQLPFVTHWRTRK